MKFILGLFLSIVASAGSALIVFLMILVYFSAQTSGELGETCIECNTTSTTGDNTAFAIMMIVAVITFIVITFLQITNRISAAEIMNYKEH